jgi:hypothetical protein
MSSPSAIAPPQRSLSRHYFRVNRKDIGYLRYTLESYDGMAMVTTVDPVAAWIEISISPGCEETILELLGSLKSDEGLFIEQRL